MADGQLTADDFRIPANFQEFPNFLESDFEWQSAPQLVGQAQKAALVWTVQYEPYWEALLNKLHKHREDLRWTDSVRLLLVFSKIDVAHPELLDYCEGVLLEQGNDLFLELRIQDIVQLGQALSKMKRKKALTAVLRSLATRGHRMEARVASELLRTSVETWRKPEDEALSESTEEIERQQAAGAARDLLEAVLEPCLESPNTHPLTLVTLAEVAAELAQASPKHLQSRGWKRAMPRLFRDLSERLQEEKSVTIDAIKSHSEPSNPNPSKLLTNLLPRIVAAGQKTGCLTPLLQAEAEVQKMKSPQNESLQKL